jgi:hypothetical protein
MKNISLFILIIFLSSCTSQKEFVGLYKSNFPESGFFTTKLKLEKNGNVIYESSGDLMYKKYRGKYQVRNKAIYLVFDEEKPKEIKQDDSIYSVLDFSKSHNYKLKNENGIPYHLKYKFRNDKLFVYNIQTDKIVKRARYYSDKKNRLKKYYLKRVE